MVSVRSGPSGLVRPVWSVPIEFPRRFISVNLHNCTYEFPRKCISVVVVVPMSSHVSILVLTHVCCFLRLH